MPPNYMTTQYSTITSSDGYSSSGSQDWYDEQGDQLFFVTSYSDFEKLAHGPRGTEASHSIYVFRFNPNDGSLVLLNIHGDPKTVTNPAFSRYHPKLNVVYTCTEDIENNGKIIAYNVGPDGSLSEIGNVDAGGTSTCYLTIDRAQKNIIATNYWNSTLSVIPISRETGEFTGAIHSMYDPKGGMGMVAAAKKDGGVNHSNNDDSTIRMRQADPHSHALVLDPFVGTIAYVPDLGKDLIREFYYDRDNAKIELELNVLPSGLCTGKPDGPRYFEFHPKYNIAYVVNELSSTIAVFSVDRTLIGEIAAAAANGESIQKFKGRTTLKLIQSIKTIPNAFPTTMNTCGRITVHKSGRFVIVSNRGHQSIAIFRVKTGASKRGELQSVGYFHTRGETPRHFQFDSSGQFLIVANQDSDSIAVFTFNLSSGEIKFSGNEYRVPSPNFVCSCPSHEQDESCYTDTQEKVVDTTSILDHVVESDSSTVPVNDDKVYLQSELAEARKEIEALKMKLAALTAEN